MVKKGKKRKDINSKDTIDDSEEINIDFSKIKKIITNPHIITIILILIPMFFAGYFRYYPANLPITDEWAEQSIISQIKSQITSNINQQYPNLPDANKQQLVNQQLNEYLENNKEGFDDAIKQNSDALKQQLKAEDGTTYLLAIDPYHFYRRSKNIAEDGHAWDIEKNGTAYDMHMIAPLGTIVKYKFNGGTFHEWAGVLIYKIMSLFNPGISYMNSFFFLPIIFSVLSIIPAFFLARKVGGNVGGFFAAMIIATHSVFLGRTPGGFSDTDAYNVFFPLLISWLFIEAFDRKKIKEKIIWASFAGIAAGLYSFAWGNYWYIFDIILYSIIGCIIYYVIYYIILHKNKLKNVFLKSFKNDNIKYTLLILIVLLITSGVLITYFMGFKSFLTAPVQPFEILNIKDVAKADLWPNVFTTVAELNSASVSQIIGQIGGGLVGGKLFFVLALVGILFTINLNKDKDMWFKGISILWFVLITYYHKSLSFFLFLILLSLPMMIGLLIPLITKEKEIDIKYAIFFTMWFMGAIFTSTKGVRFILLLVPVFGVAFGIAIGKIYDYFSGLLSKEFEINKIISKTIVILVLLLLLIGPIKAANTTALHEIPSMNDGWYQSLTKIKNEAQPDAIINSWWDFGHWFKAIGDRGVTFDGASQNTPMAHWIGKTLLTSDENTAIGILRMLDCGSNKAFEELNKIVNDTLKSIDILYEIVILERKDALEKLIEYTDENTADKLIGLTHCEPPENYFITSEDMVGKSGVWAHFGSWDFKRSKIWKDYGKLSFDEFVSKSQIELGYDEKTAEDMYYQVKTLSEGSSANAWISPWPSYMSGKSGCKDNNDNTYRCTNGLIINKTNMDASVQTGNGPLHPKTFVYLDNESNLQYKEYEKGKVITTQDGRYIGAALIKDGNSYYSILMDDDLSLSTFTKLFYFDGAGTKHFDKFSDIRDFTGQRIIVWKVNWKSE